MVNYIIYNSNKIRKYYGLCKLEDQNILENDLLYIINKYLISINAPMVNNIHDESLYRIPFEYIPLQNINMTGYIPFNYIYNDIIRTILEQNTNNNFYHTLESIYISKNSSYKPYDSINKEILDMSYKIIHDFIVSTKMPSYRYMIKKGKCILILNIPFSDGLFTYILTTGFSYNDNIDFFCTDTQITNPNALGYERYCNLKYIVYSILGKNRPSMTKDMDLLVTLEMNTNKKFNDIKYCKEYVESLSLPNIKYDGYMINDNQISSLTPAIIPSVPEYYVNTFNLPDEKLGVDFLKTLNNISEIQKKIERG